MIRVYDYQFIWHKVGGHEVTFEIANEDTSDATYQYYGYISSNGAWIIQRFKIVDATHIIYSYCAGKTRTDYDTHWDAETGAFTVGDLEFTTFDAIGANF